MCRFSKIVFEKRSYWWRHKHMITWSKQFFETILLKPERLSTRPMVAISSSYYAFPIIWCSICVILAKLGPKKGLIYIIIPPFCQKHGFWHAQFFAVFKDRDLKFFKSPKPIAEILHTNFYWATTSGTSFYWYPKKGISTWNPIFICYIG